jgi:hypothetical protein
VADSKLRNKLQMITRGAKPQAQVVFFHHKEEFGVESFHPAEGVPTKDSAAARKTPSLTLPGHRRLMSRAIAIKSIRAQNFSGRDGERRLPYQTL